MIIYTIEFSACQDLCDLKCDPPQDFSHFGADTRTTRSHDTLSVLKTVIWVCFSNKTKDTVSPCWFVFFYLPDTKKLCIVDTVP